MKEPDPKTLENRPEKEPEEKHESEAEKKETELSEDELGKVPGGGYGGSGGQTFSDARLKRGVEPLAKEARDEEEPEERQDAEDAGNEAPAGELSDEELGNVAGGGGSGTGTRFSDARLKAKVRPLAPIYE